MTAKSPMKISRIAELSLPTLSVIAVILLWELVVRWRGIAPIFLPAPSSIAMTLWDMLADGTMEYHVGVTVLRILEAFNSETADWLSMFMFAYFTDLIAWRRRSPGDDVISGLDDAGERRRADRVLDSIEDGGCFVGDCGGAVVLDMISFEID